MLSIEEPIESKMNEVKNIFKSFDGKEVLANKISFRTSCLAFDGLESMHYKDAESSSA